MANKTRGGIYYDLKESEYFVEIKGVKFFFSSLLYQQKFVEKYEEYLKNEKDYLFFRYPVLTDRNIVSTEYIMTLELIIAFTLYKKIEKRGEYYEM